MRWGRGERQSCGSQEARPRGWESTFVGPGGRGWRTGRSAAAGPWVHRPQGHALRLPVSFWHQQGPGPAPALERKQISLQARLASDLGGHAAQLRPGPGDVALAEDVLAELRLCSRSLGESSEGTLAAGAPLGTWHGRVRSQGWRGLQGARGAGCRETGGPLHGLHFLCSPDPEISAPVICPGLLGCLRKRPTCQ